jgi:cell division protein FtsQ
MARSLAAPASRRIARRDSRRRLHLPRALITAARRLRVWCAFVWTRRRLRLAVIAVALAAPLLGGGWWLARHSSLTAVEQVQVRGLRAVHGASAGASGASLIDAALTRVARGMSTLSVNTAALRAAVARYPIVRAVRAHASFPHGLRIEVLERPPVAALVIGGARTAVAADGVVLGAGYLSSSLPLVSIRAAPATPRAPGTIIRDAAPLQALRILGAARPALAHAVTRVYMGTHGLTLVLRSGLLAYFGDATRVHAKWVALTRVLADPSSAGAAYIDVRVPERPAAGFAPGTVPPEMASTEAEQPSVVDQATASELAAGLNAAVSGQASPTVSATAGTSGSTEAAGSESAASGAGGSEGTGSETPGSEGGG